MVSYILSDICYKPHSTLSCFIHSILFKKLLYPGVGPCALNLWVTSYCEGASFLRNPVQPRPNEACVLLSAMAMCFSLTSPFSPWTLCSDLWSRLNYFCLRCDFSFAMSPSCSNTIWWKEWPLCFESLSCPCWKSVGHTRLGPFLGLSCVPLFNYFWYYFEWTCFLNFIFGFFITNIQKCNWHLCPDLRSCNLAKLVYWLCYYII